MLKSFRKLSHPDHFKEPNTTEGFLMTSFASETCFRLRLRQPVARNDNFNFNAVIRLTARITVQISV